MVGTIHSFYTYLLRALPLMCYSDCNSLPYRTPIL